MNSRGPAPFLRNFLRAGSLARPLRAPTTRRGLVVLLAVLLDGDGLPTAEAARALVGPPLALGQGERGARDGFGPG